MLELAILEIKGDWVELALLIAFVVISLGIHEAAHGWVALQRGDTTARDLGRITLNPLAHIDPVMTILLPAVLFMTTGFLFGGAKPVPVNFYNLKRPYRDMALVAIAGPTSNFLIAMFLLFCQKILVKESGIWNEGHLGDRVLGLAIYFNLLIAAFNLLPIPPLDGSRVMTWLLPSSMREFYGRLEGIGLILVFAFIYVYRDGMGVVMNTMNVMHRWIESIVTLGGRW